MCPMARNCYVVRKYRIQKNDADGVVSSHIRFEAFWMGGMKRGMLEPAKRKIWDEQQNSLIEMTL